jgi:hypothetical protein
VAAGICRRQDREVIRGNDASGSHGEVGEGRVEGRIHMRKVAIGLTLGLIAAGIVVTAWPAGGRANEFKARLIGYREVPAVSSTGSGVFKAELDADAETIDYRLRYEDLEGPDALAAHIHFGQKDVNGGVGAFLCGGGDKPACPDSEGSVTGTIDAADVIGPGDQGIAPGEFGELVDAMRAGVTYVNVHTDKHGGGEIRGQVRTN